MKIKFNIQALALLAAALTAVCAPAAAKKATQKPNLLSIRNSITDTAIVYPESFETDVQKMMQNWYLQNYAALDADVGTRSVGDTSEETYIKRLQALPTQIEMPYNQIVRNYIDAYVTKHRALVEAMLGMSLYYMPIFEQALEKEGLPLELKYLPVIESAINPDAVSRSGAAGLWQIVVNTAKGLGLEVNSLVDQRRDPYASSEAAARYLKELYSTFGDWSLAIAAYNCGPGNVTKALRRAGGDGPHDFWEIYYFLPKETRTYVPSFIAANYVMTYFKLHGISPALAKKPIITDTVTVDRRLHFKQISAVLDIPIEALRVLNPQYRKDVIPATPERPYTLTLPSQQIYSFLMSSDSVAQFDQASYAQRRTAEPGMVKSPTGEYTTERQLVTKYYKVKRGDNITKIANQFGVSVADIKKWNKLKNNTVRLGESLKIEVYETVKVPVTQEEPDNDEVVVAEAAEEADTAPEPADKTDTATASQTPAKTETATAKKPAAASQKAATTGPTKHKVRRGESLSKIAAKYRGVSVADIKRANNLTSDDIKAGQTLIIPTK